MQGRSKSVLWVGLGTFLAGCIVYAQGPEKVPSTINPDWNYESPGPAKCVEIGNVYLHKRNLKGALSRFEEAVQDDPNYAPAYLGLGKVYERMNQKQKALAAFQRYLDELPSAKEAAEARYAQEAVARLRKEVKPPAPSAP
jgi:tetratricopeptide (TPR) repeat protein